MKKKNLIIYLLVLLIFILKSAIFTETVNAVPVKNLTTARIEGYIYKGILKTKNSKYGLEITNKEGTKKFIVFDADGQKLAKKLVASGKLKNNSSISVNGIIKNNIAQVFSIKSEEGKEETFAGWLGDSDCTPNLSEPGEMGVSCLKCAKCEGSGYGISVKQKDGSFKYFKFDTKGHTLVRDKIIPELKSKKVPEISVTGLLEGNNIKVTSINLK